ncbi:hypothetical protein E2C01_012746 [Portunus trituberculatus]|uniref:Uncharacterized protein n=1 Tax=Portunus trituberculatus TaxID=210409 RepID=A0A5B7DF28_PORTR|nr:hypothetical protein [Portunus trituberculatus]
MGLRAPLDMVSLHWSTCDSLSVWFMLRPRLVPGRPSGVIRRSLSLGDVYDRETELARIPHQM